MFVVAGGAVATLGAVSVVGTWNRIDDEGPANDRLVHAYVRALARGDYDAAYELVCTDETGVDKSAFVEEQQQDPVQTSQIQSFGSWSSPIDGHGRDYQVQITHASGAVTVEHIATQSGRCIQYHR
jgi:hypothetical protein